jgi:AbrB family looped-hinge helix DNA binding protein
MMEIIRLKDKGQVTIPAAIREELNAQLGDFFAVSVENGSIVLKPQALSSALPERPLDPKPSSWFGSARGVYSSVEEIDAFIQSERAQWD